MTAPAEWLMYEISDKNKVGGRMNSCCLQVSK